ncbi:MAG: ABC transporter ATP-binding protein [Proteobacteria bacterium]|nr:ABC transporter ATP-binding protein [Pseudomonadota bacterium]
MSRGLTVDRLRVVLGGHPVLRDVSFEVRPGEVVGLLGRNGAGKTTLLRVVTRAITPDGGEVRVGEMPVARLARRELARAVAIVPQETTVPFPFRAGELVLMGRAPHQPLFGFETRSDVERARAAMNRMGIGDLADRSVFELSGGERQLAVFARALVQEPEIMLLDEPTAFLDLRHRIDVLRAVREFAAAGGAALVVSHDLSLAARICDRLVLLGDGEVIAQGPAAEVLSEEVLARAFAVRADILRAPDGAPVVVPRLS